MGVLAGEDQAFLYELNADTFAGEVLDESTEVIKVSGPAVHAVHHHGVTVTGDAKHLGELRFRGVPAGGLIREERVKNLALELALLVPLQRAYPYVPDPLSAHRNLQPECL